MWRMVGVPNGMAVKVGGLGEVFVLRSLFTIIALLAVFALFAPGALSHLELWADG
jgi:hypothetical protein